MSQTSFKTVTERMAGPIGEAHTDFESKATPQERQATEAASRAVESEKRGKGKERQEELKLELGMDGHVRAKYKIEVTFGPKRTVQGPNLVGIQLWESGKQFHGGGDELVYWCKDNREDQDAGCWAPIPGDAIRDGVAMCPACKMLVNPALLTNMKIGRISSRNLSKELEKLFRSLGSNADIYLKYHYTDIRYVAMEKQKGRDVARRLKGMHIYPLRNILKDTSVGADVAGRFYAFITS